MGVTLQTLVLGDGLNQLEFRVSLGLIKVSWNGHGMLTSIAWRPHDFQTIVAGDEPPASIGEVVRRIKRYFESGTPIDDVPWYWIDQSDWTPFQRAVFAAICQIPHGETRTYGWVARRIGKVSATRAVGQALRNNPLPILIPCHRVTSSDSIGGFMGCDNPDLPEVRFKSALIGIEESYRQPGFDFRLELGQFEAC